jgi:hypothetical protein
MFWIREKFLAAATIPNLDRPNRSLVTTLTILSRISSITVILAILRNYFCCFEQIILSRSFFESHMSGDTKLKKNTKLRLG